MTADRATTAALDGAEATRLTRLERTVDRAVDVAGKIAGEALATIRDERLYLATHATFEAYTDATWGLGSPAATRMIVVAQEDHLR